MFSRNLTIALVAAVAYGGFALSSLSAQAQTNLRYAT